MKTSAFISIVSDAYKVPEKTVRTFDRFMKEAGLITSGARGVNAPDMTALDCARMTIGLLAAEIPSLAVERVKRFGAMPFVARRSRGTVPEMFADGATTFEQALTAHFSLDPMTAHFPRWYFEVHENAKKALIINGFQPETNFEAVFSDHSSEDRFELQGIRRARGVAASELSQLWVPLHLSSTAPVNGGDN